MAMLYKPKFVGSIPDDIFDILYLFNPSLPHCGPEVDSASNRNEYQGSSLEVKAAGE
jgi:hypothetical protein